MTRIIVDPPPKFNLHPPPPYPLNLISSGVDEKPLLQFLNTHGKKQSNGSYFSYEIGKCSYVSKLIKQSTGGYLSFDHQNSSSKTSNKLNIYLLVNKNENVLTTTASQTPIADSSDNYFQNNIYVYSALIALFSLILILVAFYLFYIRKKDASFKKCKPKVVNSSSSNNNISPPTLSTSKAKFHNLINLTTTSTTGGASNSINTSSESTYISNPKDLLFANNNEDTYKNLIVENRNNSNYNHILFIQPSTTATPSHSNYEKYHQSALQNDNDNYLNQFLKQKTTHTLILKENNSSNKKSKLSNLISSCNTTKTKKKANKTKKTSSSFSSTYSDDSSHSILQPMLLSKHQNRSKNNEQQIYQKLFNQNQQMTINEASNYNHVAAGFSLNRNLSTLSPAVIYNNNNNWSLISNQESLGLHNAPITTQTLSHGMGPKVIQIVNLDALNISTLAEASNHHHQQQQVYECVQLIPANILFNLNTKNTNLTNTQQNYENNKSTSSDQVYDVIDDILLPSPKLLLPSFSSDKNKLFSTTTSQSYRTLNENQKRYPKTNPNYSIRLNNN